MTDKQRQQLRDVDSRAQPLFSELARLDEKISSLQEQLFSAQTKRRRVKAHIDILSDEKSQVWADIFASMEG